MAGPSEQHFSCQSCRCRLVITDLEPHEQGSRSGLLTGSVFAGGKVDESFIFLDPSTRQQANQGGRFSQSAVRNCSCAFCQFVSTSARPSSSLHQSIWGPAAIPCSAGDAQQPSLECYRAAGRNLDESFVMLTGSASLLQQPGPMRNASHAVPMQALDDRFSQLARTFELASGETTARPCYTIILPLISHHDMCGAHTEHAPFSLQ